MVSLAPGSGAKLGRSCSANLFIVRAARVRTVRAAVAAASLVAGVSGLPPARALDQASTLQAQSPFPPRSTT
eukprot:8426010-Alexandrium_andersonii.AAC.1